MININSYQCPSSLENALSLMADDEYSPIAGGTDLIPQLRENKSAKVLDIENLGLKYIKENDDHIEIGAACSHTTVTTSSIINKYIPLVGIASGLVGSRQIRNRGTIGGNIVNASPCADTLPTLLNYDTELVLVSKNNTRLIKLSEFITHPYKTGRRSDELLKCIICKKDNSSTGHSYIKLGRRQAVNISRMTVSVSIRNINNLIEEIQISAGSVFPIVSRMIDLEKMLIDQNICSKLFKEAGKFAAELMIKHSGTRWSTPYKEPVLNGLVIRALEESAVNTESKQ